MKKYKIPKEGRNDYGSHLEFLNEILEAAPDKINVLEFGCGRFSTFTFLNCKKVANVVSIEMQDKNYMYELAKEIGDIPNWLFSFVPTPTLVFGHSEVYFKQFTPHIALVDGHLDNRPECVNFCIENKIPVIVAHDFQYPGYGWQRIKYSDDYKKEVKLREDGQQTLVLTLK